MRRHHLVAVMAMLLSVLSVAQAWHRDLTLEALPTGCAFDNLQPNNVVIEDVVPVWPGKEIIQATYSHVYVIRADNSEMITLDVPLIQPNPELDPARQWAACYVPIHTAQTHEFVTGVPAAGDVDGDGSNEIVVGLTNCFEFIDTTMGMGQCPFDNPMIVDFYSTIVWWKWDDSQQLFVRYYRDLHDDMAYTPVFLGTPVICRTGMTGGDPTVVFYGPGECLRQPPYIGPTQVYSAIYTVTSFDLRSPGVALYSISPPTGLIGGIADATEAAYGAGGLFCAQAGDLNGDGLDEIVIHDPYLLHALEWGANGWTELAGFSTYWVGETGRFWTGSHTLADVDGDGALDILAPVTYGGPPFSSRLLRIYQNGGSVQYYGPSPSNTGSLATCPAVANWSDFFASSGQLPGTLNPLIQTIANTDAYLPAGARIPQPSGWPVDRVNNYTNLHMYKSNVSTPAIADIAGLGYPQFVDATIGRLSAGVNEINAYDPRDVSAPVIGGVIDLDVLIPDYGENIQTPSIPAVVDVDEDGLTEVVVTYRTDTNTLRVFSEDRSSAYNHPLTEWSQFQNGPEHKGLYAQPVTGVQTQTNAVWSGKIVVHNDYTVGQGQTLTIKPGTIVKLAANANIIVSGELIAQGTATDSIYFQRFSANSAWGQIAINNAGVGRFAYCAVTGGTTLSSGDAQPLTVENCRIGNMTIGITINGAASRERMIISHNLIHDCDWYGLYGNQTTGQILYNMITGCNCAGINWMGDYASGALRFAYFEGNEVYANALDLQYGMGGGMFCATTANLQCNRFEGNGFTQIFCAMQANLMLNSGYLGFRGGRNVLSGSESSFWCGLCTIQGNPPSCRCPAWDQDFTPLLILDNSRPLLRNGQNTFRFEVDGVFIYDYNNCWLPTVNLQGNYYEAGGVLESPPSLLNPHFCPPGGFSDPNPLTHQYFCPLPIPFSGLTASETLFQQAVQSEANGDYAVAATAFSNVVTGYPESPEALSAVRGVLRNRLEEDVTTSAAFNEMQTLQINPALPQAVREEAVRQSIWALISGSLYVDARQELQPLLTGANGAADSIWALTMAALIDYSETSQTMSMTVSAANRWDRVTRMDDAIHRAMGRATNSEIAAKKAAVVESKDLASAYPNPFNSTVNIRLNLPEAATVKLEIFNLLGQKVATLANLPLDAGSHVYRWNAAGNASGVYLYRLEAGAKVESHKLLLMK